MDPASAYAALKVTGAVAGAAGGYAQSMDASARAEAEARLADTQGLQRDAAAREELTSYLSTVQAARAANGQAASSPLGFQLMQSAWQKSDQDRTIQRSDDKLRAANMRAAAKAYKRRGTMSLVTGAVGAAIPLSQYQMYLKGLIPASSIGG